jgi:hypothetical protein
MVQLSAVVQRGQTGSTLRRRQGGIGHETSRLRVCDRGLHDLRGEERGFRAARSSIFVNDAAHFDTSIGSARKFAIAAATAGATVLMTNQSEFDNAASKISPRGRRLAFLYRDWQPPRRDKTRRAGAAARDSRVCCSAITKGGNTGGHVLTAIALRSQQNRAGD